MTNEQFTIRGRHSKYPYNQGKHLMAIVNLFAYADESGIDGKPSYCVVSGYIAPQRVWESFGAEWKNILSEYQVSEFHAKEFFKRYRGTVATSNFK
jgi:hypothetical protein